MTTLRFSDADRAVLLAVKGVGPTVVARLEQLGFESLQQLADAEPADIVAQASAMLGSTCWRNSPQARAAITGAIDAAKQHR
jgi:predicted flap endonuclease-1-like 5' DNA nuclease